MGKFWLVLELMFIIILAIPFFILNYILDILIDKATKKAMERNKRKMIEDFEKLKKDL